MGYPVQNSFFALIKTRTNCPYASTFLDIYIPLARLYIYIYLYKYIYTHIQIYIHIYLHFLLLNWQHFHWGCYAWKSLIICPFSKKFKTKIFIFEYFPKIPLEMSSTHPFYPIDPTPTTNTSYVKKNSLCS